LFEINAEIVHASVRSKATACPASMNVDPSNSIAPLTPSADHFGLPITSAS
jgi:hypothetical protein